MMPKPPLYQTAHQSKLVWLLRYMRTEMSLHSRWSQGQLRTWHLTCGSECRGICTSAPSGDLRRLPARLTACPEKQSVAGPSTMVRVATATRSGLGWSVLPQEGKSQSTALYCRKAQAGSSEGQETEETGRSLRTASSKCKIGHTCAWEDTWTELCRQLHAVEGLPCPGWRGMEHSTCPAHAPGHTGLGLKHLGKTSFLSSGLGPVPLSLSAGSCSPHQSGNEWKAPSLVCFMAARSPLDLSQKNKIVCNCQHTLSLCPSFPPGEITHQISPEFSPT